MCDDRTAVAVLQSLVGRAGSRQYEATNGSKEKCARLLRSNVVFLMCGARVACFSGAAIFGSQKPGRKDRDAQGYATVFGHLGLVT